jgi:hypothetical protein
MDILPLLDELRMMARNALPYARNIMLFVGRDRRTFLADCRGAGLA